MKSCSIDRWIILEFLVSSDTISSQYLSDINIELIIELFSDSKLRYQVSRSTQGIGFHLTFPQKILIKTPRSPREFNATSGRGGG